MIVPDLLLAKLIDYLHLYSISSITLSKLQSYLFIILAIFISVKIIERMSVFFVNFVFSRLNNELKAKFVSKVFDHLAQLDMDYIKNQQSGALTSKIIRGGNSFQPFLNIFRHNLIPFFVQIPIVLSLLFIINIKIGLILLISAIIYVLVSIRFSRVTTTEYKKHFKDVDFASGILTDFVSNLYIIKVMSRESFVSRKLKASINFFYKFGKIIGRLMAHWSLWPRLVSTSAQIFALVYGVILVIEGELSIGSLTLIFLFSHKLMSLADYVVYSFDFLLQSASQFNAAANILKEKSKIIEDKDAKTLKVDKGKIEFNNISFDYENKKVFSKFNLKIKQGETIGIVGKSGAGKSTLIKLLYRLHDVDQGYISIDGQNIKHVTKHSLRSSIMLVPQETFLFDDTIYNNIRFAKFNSTPREIVDAIKKAELWDFVKSLPKKEKTIVGERGLKLSGGERQRIAIARALLANKKIVVLDEATSSLDSETEAKIKNTLDKVTKGKTTIIVAHRLSTVLNADKIIVFDDDGTILEQGTHKQLIRKKGKYSKLWKYQSKGFI